MNLLAKFEELAEQLFTGVFKKSGDRLQPVEVAKELVKAMWKHKQISISKVYVPNVYRVYLHPQDWKPLVSFGDAFRLELSKYLFEEGEQSGYTFLTKPAVELYPDESIKPGELFIEVDFDDTITVDWADDQSDEFNDEGEMAGEKREARDDEIQSSCAERTAELSQPQQLEVTAIFNKFDQQESFSQIGSRNSCDYLEIIEGPDKGKSYVLDGDGFYLGRHFQCQFVLNDPEVSRRHLHIRRAANGWLIEDLGSTNGTYVNGVRIRKQVVYPGDKIRVGSTLLVLTAREP